MLDYLVSKQFDTELTAPSLDPALLAKINVFAREPLSAEQVYVAEAKLANDQVDRSYEKFPLTYLERFAATIPGKALLPGHDQSAVPIGRWIDGAVEQDAAGVNHLVARFYVPAESEIANRLKMGIAKDVSIRFKAAGRTCDLCGSPFDGPKGCEHQKGQEYDGKLCTATYSGDVKRVEALEGSLVWLACQHGTQVVGAKSAGAFGGQVLEIEDRGGDAAGENKMLKEEEVTALQAKAAGLETKLKEYEAQAKAFEAREGRAKDGDAYHDWLRLEIARKMSAAASDKDLADTILKTLATADLTTLVAWDKRAQAQFDEKFPPTTQSKQLGEGAIPAPAPGQNVPQPFDPHASLKRAY